MEDKSYSTVLPTSPFYSLISMQEVFGCKPHSAPGAAVHRWGLTVTGEQVMALSWLITVEQQTWEEDRD